jgi:AcrR family transcriptional regulator
LSTSAHAGALTENAVAKRLEIVAAAAELFDERGFHQVSMDAIAERVGIRKPTLYHYVRSKEDILYWIHEACTDRLLERHIARLKTPMSAQQYLLELMADIIELTEEHKPEVRVFFEYYREISGERYEEILAKRHRYVAMVEEIVQAGIRDGEFRADVEPTLIMMAIFGMSNWAYQWFRPDGPLRGREVAYAFWDIALNGLRPADAVTSS